MTLPSSLASEILKAKYDFNWEVLDVIISGKSSIDSTQGLQLGSAEEMDRFIFNYGYDLENPIERAEVHGNFHEALNFIRKHFLQPESPDGLKLEIPKKILEITDIRDLFKMANPGISNPHHVAPQPDPQHLGLWACSILKMMHTISHVDKDVRTTHFSDIQKQIFDQYYKVIHRDDEGRLFLGADPADPFRVELEAFETKPKKTRDSTILKLLHKPENVAEELFDRIGVRFVTPTLVGALRVVRYLKHHMIIIPPNIKPSRSRNTLIDLEHFKEGFTSIRQKLEEGSLSEEQLRSELELIAVSPKHGQGNRHSSEFYQALQFTCRQLIKLKNPLYDELKELKHLAKAQSGLKEEISRAIDRIDLRGVQKEVRFFYPYEVQILDKKSAMDNEIGRSAHSEYKRAQLQTALTRVMGSLTHVVR